MDITESDIISSGIMSSLINNMLALLPYKHPTNVTVWSECDLQRKQPVHEIRLVAAIVDIEDIQCPGGLLQMGRLFVWHQANGLTVGLKYIS